MGGHLQHPLWCRPWEAWCEGHWPLPHESDLLALSQSPGSLWTYKGLAFAPDFSTGNPVTPGVLEAWRHDSPGMCISVCL